MLDPEAWCHGNQSMVSVVSTPRLAERPGVGATRLLFDGESGAHPDCDGTSLMSQQPDSRTSRTLWERLEDQGTADCRT